MKRVNIYINEQTKNSLSNISKKYKLSFSAIASICVKNLYYLIEMKQVSEDIKNIYISKGGMCPKTSIKPKIYRDNEIINKGIEHKDLFTTNALFIYANKKIKNFVKDPEYIKIYYDKINNDLNKEKDQFYNYNIFIRSTMRSFKDNKDYFKRKIAQMENQ